MQNTPGQTVPPRPEGMGAGLKIGLGCMGCGCLGTAMLAVVIAVILVLAPRGRQAETRRGGAPGAAVVLEDVRVQLARGENAPGVSRVASGQEFWVVFYSRAREAASGVEARYSLLENGRELHSDSSRTPSLPAGATLIDTMNGINIGLPADVSERTYLLECSLTADGLSQSRQIPITVYR
jgi:hypothetical protein